MLRKQVGGCAALQHWSLVIQNILFLKACLALGRKTATLTQTQTQSRKKWTRHKRCFFLHSVNFPLTFYLGIQQGYFTFFLSFPSLFSGSNPQFNFSQKKHIAVLILQEKQQNSVLLNCNRNNFLTNLSSQLFNYFAENLMFKNWIQKYILLS